MENNKIELVQINNINIKNDMFEIIDNSVNLYTGNYIEENIYYHDGNDDTSSSLSVKLELKNVMTFISDKVYDIIIKINGLVKEIQFIKEYLDFKIGDYYLDIKIIDDEKLSLSIFIKKS